MRTREPNRVFVLPRGTRERREERRLLAEGWIPGWRTWLPLALVVLSLASLLLAPLMMERRIRALRGQIEDDIVPARTQLGALQAALAGEVAAVSGYLLTGDEGRRERAAEAARDYERAVEGLRVLLAGHGELAAHAEELQRRAKAWHVGSRQAIDRPADRPRLLARLPEQQRLFEEALGAVARLDQALVAADTGLRARIRRLTRDQTRWTRALVLLALASAGAVAWLGGRSRRLARSLRYRIDEEVALRKVARGLSGALTTRDVVQTVVDAAVQTTRAFGAYVEEVRDGEVEVMAGAGTGVPPVGTRVSYPGSLTQAIIDSDEAALVKEVGGIGESMVPYLRASCGSCTALIVPLVAEGNVLGALVLLRGQGQEPFAPAEAGHAGALGDLASAALRRAALFEETERQRGRAEAAVRTRDDVLAIVSHDLRNPLNSLVMSAHILLEQEREEDRRRPLQVMLRASERMNRLIEDLLDVTRLEAGHGLSMNVADVDVAALAREACEAASAAAESRSQALTCEVPAGLPAIMADRARLFQVLSNLLGNALKFTPAGGRVTVGGEAEGSEVRIWVTDTGPGIPEDHLRHLFDPFWQARQTARLGSGLGLTISRGIVVAHGGRLWVETRPGAGSTFFFTLPVAGPAPGERELAVGAGTSSPS